MNVARNSELHACDSCDLRSANLLKTREARHHAVYIAQHMRGVHNSELSLACAASTRDNTSILQFLNVKWRTRRNKRNKRWLQYTLCVHSQHGDTILLTHPCMHSLRSQRRRNHTGTGTSLTPPALPQTRSRAGHDGRPGTTTAAHCCKRSHTSSRCAWHA